MHQALMAVKLLVLMLMVSSAGVSGQAANPFDLRKSQTDSEASQADGETIVDSAVLRNPFDLRPAFEDQTPEVTESGLRDWVHKVLNSPADPTEIRNFLFWLLLFLTFMLAIALNLNRSFVSRLFRSNFNLNLASVLYRDKLSPDEREICDQLCAIMDSELTGAESKVWHAHPVWFLDGNPIVGYSKQKAGIPPCPLELFAPN